MSRVAVPWLCDIWAPNQVEWPRLIGSELRVGSLGRPKRAVHGE